jgi:hypothetical protein
VHGWAGGWADEEYVLGGQSSGSGTGVGPPHALLLRRDRRAGVLFDFNTVKVVLKKVITRV